jgi:hypothetical protein
LPAVAPMANPRQHDTQTLFGGLREAGEFTEATMSGAANKDKPTDEPSLVSGRSTTLEYATPEDDEYEDGDFVTPKYDRADPDDEPL